MKPEDKKLVAEALLMHKARANPDVVLYHRTTPANAAKIVRGRRWMSREQPPYVFFSTDPHGHGTSYGEALLEVVVPEAVARLDDEFPSGEQHYAVLTRDLAGLPVRLVEADLRSNPDADLRSNPSTWEQEGYRIEFSSSRQVNLYETDPKKRYWTLYAVRAFDPYGKLVGSVDFGEGDYFGETPGTLSAGMVDVLDGHQRKGLASAMYRRAEQETGMKVGRPVGGVQTKQGKAFRAAYDDRSNPDVRRPRPRARAREEDMLDAIQHADVYGDQGWTLDDFTILPMGEVPMSRVLGYEDCAWLDVDPEDFAGMSAEERLDELSSFRGPKWAARAAEWLSEGVPPIVVIDAPVVDEAHLYRQIGDGRGRVNFALAMGLKTLPVVIMKWKHPL